MLIRTGMTAVLLAAALGAQADDRQAYNQRAATADLAAFQSLDRNGDGVLTPEEARGAVDFAPRFNDIDINRDGFVTLEEMRRYVERAYGVKPAG